jgi:hypothetical protein
LEEWRDPKIPRRRKKTKNRVDGVNCEEEKKW